MSSSHTSPPLSPETHSEYEALVAISRHMSSTLDPQTLLQKILDTTVEATHADTGTLVLMGESSSRMKIVAAHGIPEEDYRDFRLRVGVGITGWVAKHGESLLVNDVNRDERYVPLFLPVRSEMAVPLTLEGRVIGVLNVDSGRENAFTERQLKLLNAIAQQSVQVVNVSRLYVELKRRAEVFRALSTIAAEIGSTLNLNQVLSRIVTRSAELMGTKLCSLFLTDENCELLTLVAAHGAGEDYLRRPSLEVNWSLVGQVIRSREALAIQEVRQHPWYKSVEVAEKEGLVSMLAVPLITGGSSPEEKNAIGVLVTYTDHPHYFEEEERELFMAFAHHAAIAIENARLYELRVKAEDRVRENEKLVLLGQMAAGVAHEVRNPLGGIRGAAQLLLREVADRADLRECGEVILSETDRLNRMVEELLDFARPFRLRLQRKDLAQMVRRLILPLKSFLEEKKIEIKAALPDEPVRVLVDEERIQQVVWNLLLNATQAVEEGCPEGKRREVGIEVWQERDYAGITVTDTGPGIGEETMDRVFTPFVTTRSKGTGLGLSVVKRLVEAHRGEVILSNRAPEVGGLAAVVRLPLSKVSGLPGEDADPIEKEREEHP